MDDIITTVVIAVIASSGFWALVQAVLIKRLAKKSNLETAMLGMLYTDIKALGNEYITRGYISTDELNDLHRYLVDPYFSMDGDGAIHALMKQVENLPISEEKHD